MDVRDLLRMVQGGWRPGPIDLLIADPPCTPWSRAGKRLGQEDERDMMATTVELVRLLKPRAYLIANVRAGNKSEWPCRRRWPKRSPGRSPRRWRPLAVSARPSIAPGDILT